jgi:glycerol-3-phosphate acyltransferase PlsY
MSTILLMILAFFSGSLPFSVWLGKLFMGLDVRRFGDGNPGSTNVFRAGNRALGLIALLLDVSKAALPVGLAYHNLGLRGLPMFCIALAPLLGHVFSPFLGFRGGKGVAAALGIWIGLTLWKASLAGVLGVTVGVGLFTVSGWAVLAGLLGVLLSLLAWLPETLFFAVLAGQALILVWTHRHDLRQPLCLRDWLTRHLPGSRT